MNGSNDKPTLLTAEGKQKLEEELTYLVSDKRAQVAERIRQAKEEGDLRENAEYDDAKLEQGFVEGRIRELEYLLKNVEIIEASGSSRVELGSTVTVREEGTEYDETYVLVGPTEANPAKGRISNVSPLGQALLGKGKGQSVTFDSPGGEIIFEVLQVE
ncbi:MAG: transcription elongation factor GreA [Anaerolineales bacterium]|nr:transcription elongation factor GreA [Anaerolineales bacterium]MCB9129109.1 transcription elongation factor GreA [Ardenticatenales bacterium]